MRQKKHRHSSAPRLNFEYRKTPACARGCSKQVLGTWTFFDLASAVQALVTADVEGVATGLPPVRVGRLGAIDPDGGGRGPLAVRGFHHGVFLSVPWLCRRGCEDFSNIATTNSGVYRNEGIPMV
jgi:hypothetical protein